MNVYPHLNGRRAVLDLRCSTTRQTNTSIPDQEREGLAFCEANGLTVVKVFRQEGVTASVPGARSDFEDIIQRKKTLNDFDVVVLTDITRLTRAGIKHGMNVEYELEIAGIEVAFVTTVLPPGEDGDLIKPAYYFAAKMWVRTLAFAVARGMMSAFESGGMAHCNIAPYGLDFMYTVDDKPSHVTRILRDGRQLKLHPDAMGRKPTPQQILQVFPKNPKKAKSLHYRKQSNEKVVLVPGDPDELATVIMMFTLFLKHNKGAHRIAVELNDRGICSPRGGIWSAESVAYILQNKVYLGTGITNMKTRAVHAARNTNSPKARKISPAMLAQKRETLPLETRPREEWQERQYPELLHLLDGDLRPLAEKHIERMLARRAGMVLNPVRRRPRHPDSDYLLTGILRSKQGGHVMGGFSTYGRGKRYRKYSINKFRTSPISDKTLMRRVDADGLETAVLSAFEKIFIQAPDMTVRLEKAIKAEQKTRVRDHGERSELLRQRDEIQEEYRDLLSLGKHGRELVKQKIQRCERQLEELAIRIEDADAMTGAALNPQQQAKAIIEELAAVAVDIRKMPSPLLKRLAEIMISKIEIDLETFEFELEIAVPSWAMIDAKAFKDALRLEVSSHMPTKRETKPDDGGFLLGRFACSPTGEPKCFQCHRLKKAA